MKRTDRVLLGLFWWWLYRRLMDLLQRGRFPWNVF